MVGCTIFTLPPSCGELFGSVESGDRFWWVPSSRPFTLGPFSAAASWVSESSWAIGSRGGGGGVYESLLSIDQEYSVVMLACDVFMTLAWHFTTKHVVGRRGGQFRLKYLSPSVRFTLGVLFGALRLWGIAHLHPTPLYSFLSRFCFFVYLILGLSALVFDDGPWRGVRPNAKSALDSDSLLNPYATINKALNTSVTKLTLARPAVRRSLESGGIVTIVLDSHGSLIFACRGTLDIREASKMRKANNVRCVIELVARKEVCKSGEKFFFGFVHGAPFLKFGKRSLTLSQQQTLLELMINLNELKINLSGSASLGGGGGHGHAAELIVQHQHHQHQQHFYAHHFVKPSVRWFQVTQRPKGGSDDEEYHYCNGEFDTQEGIVKRFSDANAQWTSG